MKYCSQKFGGNYNRNYLFVTLFMNSLKYRTIIKMFKYPIFVSNLKHFREHLAKSVGLFKQLIK